jgi:hypothetical protein
MTRTERINLEAKMTHFPRRMICLAQLAALTEACASFPVPRNATRAQLREIGRRAGALCTGDGPWTWPKIDMTEAQVKSALREMVKAGLMRTIPTANDGALDVLYILTPIGRAVARSRRSDRCFAATLRMNGMQRSEVFRG